MSHDAILDAVAEIIGDGGTPGEPIAPSEVARCIQSLADCGLVDLNSAHPTLEAAGWARLLHDDAYMYPVVSILAPPASEADATARNSSVNPGDIRYDEPGSMHPLARPVVIFAAAAWDGHTMRFLRSRCARLVVVAE